MGFELEAIRKIGQPNALSSLRYVAYYHNNEPEIEKLRNHPRIQYCFDASDIHREFPNIGEQSETD